MEFLQELKHWRIEDRSLVLDGGWEGQIRLTPALPGVLQVRLERSTPWSREAIAPSLSVHPETWPPLPPPLVKERPDGLLAAFEGLIVEVTRDPIRISYFLPDGTPLLAESDLGGLWKDGWQVGCRFRLDPGDQFFGLGEPDQRQGAIPFNHKGRRYPLWNKHLPAPSRLVLPVLVSLRGYGLFIDNPWPAEWDLGQDGKTFGYSAQGGQITYYVMAGPDLPGVLDRYTALTGRPSMAPKWSFGLLQSKFGYKTRAEVEHLVATFRAREIPLDAVILDLYWFRRMGDLCFDKSAFPDPTGMIAALREQCVRLIVIEEPYIATDSRLFPEAERLGLLGRRLDGTAYTIPFWAGECGIVDFTQPLARQWWADQHQPLMEMGIAGWWTDLNEPEDHPQDMLHGGGIAPAVHNLFALYMCQSLKLAQEQHDPSGRLFIMSRAGWPGTQALGAGQWSGDVEARWEDLANQIPLGLSMGMTGMAYWNTDIGGFRGEQTSPELYIRWMQFGAFTPTMRPHGAHQDREPWAFGPEAEAIATTYTRLRYWLLPYTYTLAREAYTRGLPFMRPLVLHYTGDPQTWSLRDQFMWGRDMLVAPVVTEGQTSRKVYLPDGVWYDFWTGRRFQGGRHVTAAAPLDTLPLYVRAGAIIPMAPDRPSTGGAWEELTLAVFPDTIPSGYSLYEDDGETTAFEHGEYATTVFACSPEPAGGLTISIGGSEGPFADRLPARTYGLEVRLPRRPAGVSAGTGADLTARRSLESLQRAGSGWWYDSRRKVLHVWPGAVGGNIEITIW